MVNQFRSSQGKGIYYWELLGTHDRTNSWELLGITKRGYWELLKYTGTNTMRVPIIIILLFFVSSSGCLSEPEKKAETIIYAEEVKVPTPEYVATTTITVPVPTITLSVNTTPNVTEPKQPRTVLLYTYPVNNSISLVIELPIKEISGNLTFECDKYKQSRYPFFMKNTKLFEFENYSCTKNMGTLLYDSKVQLVMLPTKINTDVIMNLTVK